MTHKFQNIVLRKTFSNFLGLAMSFFLSACSVESKSIKNGILGALPDAKSEIISVDLSKFSEKKIMKICIQTPYMTSQILEQRVGEHVEHFIEVDDKFFVLWIFYDQASPTQVKFDRWHEINFGEPASLRCISSSSVYLINSQLHLEPI